MEAPLTNCITRCLMSVSRIAALVMMILWGECSIAPARDDKRFVVEPQSAMFLQHGLGRLKV